MSLELADYGRFLNLASSIVLAWGSYRAHRWARTQAKLNDMAAHNDEKASSTAPVSGKADSVVSAAAETLSGPFFDVTAYKLFIVGFVGSSLAVIFDMVANGTFGRLMIALGILSASK